MATVEVALHGAGTPQQYGGVLPVKRLPSGNLEATTGSNPADTVTIASAKIVVVTPSADVRMSWTADGTNPPDPTGSASYALLKSGIGREFYIDTPGTKLRFG